MQHIHISDATSCTFVSIDGAGMRLKPTAEAARLCSQCEQLTWRRTPVCMHCGHDRFARARWLAGTVGAAAVSALVIFHSPALMG